MEILPASNHSLLCESPGTASWQMKATNPALKTSEIAFLGKAKTDAADPVNGWRTISLLAHGGKAMMRCIWRQILPKVAPKILEAQFGGVPGKGTREAVLVATEIIARFHKATKGSGKSRRPPMYLAAVLFDLVKAFDKVGWTHSLRSPGRQSTDGRTGHVPRGDAQRHLLLNQGSQRADPETGLDLERVCARARWRDL